MSDVYEMFQMASQTTDEEWAEYLEKLLSEEEK
jgi:hypothetical protein